MLEKPAMRPQITPLYTPEGEALALRTHQKTKKMCQTRWCHPEVQVERWVRIFGYPSGLLGAVIDKPGAQGTVRGRCKITLLCSVSPPPQPRNMTRKSGWYLILNILISFLLLLEWEVGTIDKKTYKTLPSPKPPFGSNYKWH